MYKYVEIVEHETERVIKRYGVTLMSEDGVDTVEDGCNDTINHNLHFVRRVECETELETGTL
jgi:hypothetical protein